MTHRTSPHPLRRTAAVGALLLALTACTPDAQDDPEPTAAATGGPVVVGAQEYEPILEMTLPVPRSAEGNETTVGLVSPVQSGRTTELRLVLTPSFPEAEEGEEISVYDMFGEDVFPVIWDVAGLRSYNVVSDTGRDFETDVVRATAANGEPVLYQAFFPALEDRPETVDLALHPSWPVLEDVPVTYED
ncbi:hypothetical protein [Cellulomonas cellasea]|uniref:Lipoprotein n=1 Tax=Cellulomonas cellasea TaxID=43670 RepID=A0A7W4UHN4_9CELL|nr:hypothetical protein [Cellulomonas cellasea]MBB2924342.1 hypothetical protein [Cellulomonas cellasea]